MAIFFACQCCQKYITCKGPSFASEHKNQFSAPFTLTDMPSSIYLLLLTICVSDVFAICPFIDVSSLKLKQAKNWQNALLFLLNLVARLIYRFLVLKTVGSHHQYRNLRSSVVSRSQHQPASMMKFINTYFYHYDVQCSIIFN